jgi:hypothetical protein
MPPPEEHASSRQAAAVRVATRASPRVRGGNEAGEDWSWACGTSLCGRAMSMAERTQRATGTAWRAPSARPLARSQSCVATGRQVGDGPRNLLLPHRDDPPGAPVERRPRGPRRRRTHKATAVPATPGSTAATPPAASGARPTPMLCPAPVPAAAAPVPRTRPAPSRPSPTAPARRTPEPVPSPSRPPGRRVAGHRHREAARAGRVRAGHGHDQQLETGLPSTAPAPAGARARTGGPGGADGAPPGRPAVGGGTPVTRHNGVASAVVW